MPMRTSRCKRGAHVRALRRKARSRTTGINTSTNAAADVTFYPLRHLISKTNAPLSHMCRRAQSLRLLSGPEGPEPALGRLGLVKNTQTRRPPQKPMCSRGYQIMVPPQTQAAAHWQPRDPLPPSGPGPGVPGRACVTILKLTIRTCGQNESRSASHTSQSIVT